MSEVKRLFGRAAREGWRSPHERKPGEQRRRDKRVMRRDVHEDLAIEDAYLIEVTCGYCGAEAQVVLGYPVGPCTCGAREWRRTNV